MSRVHAPPPPGIARRGPSTLPDAHVDAIERSHQRSAAWGLTRFEQRDPDPAARAELRVLRDLHRGLFTHASPVMETLFGQIVNTESMVVLCDPTGTIIHSIGDDDFLERAAKVALQPGVNWSEAAKGTNAIGTALVDECPTLVHGNEHFLYANDFLTCSAAPILDPRGRLAGVLDVTGDERSYHQHTMALVRMSVRMIENRWLDHEFADAVRLHFHRRPELIGTLTEGQLALSPEGGVLAANRGALELLGLSGASVRRHDLGSLFGETIAELVDHARRDGIPTLRLQAPGTQALDLFARLEGPPWRPRVAVAGPLAAAPPATLAAQEVCLVQQALAAADGNVTRAARELGISRSTIYRKLKAAKGDA